MHVTSISGNENTIQLKSSTFIIYFILLAFAVKISPQTAFHSGEELCRACLYLQYLPAVGLSRNLPSQTPNIPFLKHRKIPNNPQKIP